MVEEGVRGLDWRPAVDSAAGEDEEYRGLECEEL